MPDSQLDARLTSQQVVSLPRAAALPARKHGTRTIIHHAAMRWHEVAARSIAAVLRINWRSARAAARRLWPFRTHRRRVAATLLIVGLIGIGTSVSTWRVVADLEDRDANREFKVRASNHATLLQRGFDEYLSKLVAIRALFDGSTAIVDREEFAAFTRAITVNQTVNPYLSWVPRVVGAARKAHELAAVKEGLTDYRISDVGADGRLVTSPDRDEYFPKFFISGSAAAASVYGIDLGQPTRRRPLDVALDSGEMAASPVFNLVSAVGDRDRQGFFIVLPVYGHGEPHDTVAERRRNLAGFVQGTFQISTMVDGILARLEAPVDEFLFAADAGPDTLPLYIHPSTLRKGQLQPERLGTLTAGRHWAGELRVADARWTLIVTPISGQPLSYGWAWIILAAGLSLTGGVLAFLWTSGRHTISLEQANRTIATLADADPLTGLANRRVFLDRLALAVAANRRAADPFAILLLDLDNFKNINDTLGHPAGDTLLCEVAVRLSQTVRETDLVARLGGDEFAILQLGVTNPDYAGALASRIAASLAAPCKIAGSNVHATVSIGIGIWSAAIASSEALVMQADLALYRAKGDGRNCYRFHVTELDRQVHERVVVAEELRLGIERGELELHYQPLVELRSGRIIGLEALARWNHPERGLVMPSVFIPLAEQSGSIVALGRWVIDEACRQLRLWRDQKILAPLVSVNVSALQLRDGCDLARDVNSSLARWGIAPTDLEIELTESVLMEAAQRRNKSLEQLRQLGVRIAIDDFGTGYSSFGYLATYPVTRLKIAQELVFPATTDSRSAAVVRAAIDLGNALGIEVIAEGVETDAHARFLATAGCDQAQGYHFSRPLNAACATELLRDRSLAGAPMVVSHGTAASRQPAHALAP
jgi:diguanylate cyclase (GGDEF)-like protein